MANVARHCSLIFGFLTFLWIGSEGDVRASSSEDLGISAGITDPAAFEKSVMALSERVLQATVGVHASGGSGSGILISAKGLVMTAGHVSGRPGEEATVILHDGTKLKAVNLGLNEFRDSGLMRITEEERGPLPFVEFRTVVDLSEGDWCVALGHPGGYQEGRPPVVRIGRVLNPEVRVGDSAHYICTDCPLIGGDSGGPLFDLLSGQLIGINSRIENDVTLNYHVPITTYRQGWDRLLKGEEWTRGRATLGIRGVEDHSLGAKIQNLIKGRPAQRFGLRDGDVIHRFDGERVRAATSLKLLLMDRRPGDRVRLQVFREGAPLSLTLVLGQRGGGK